MERVVLPVDRRSAVDAAWRLSLASIDDRRADLAILKREIGR